MLPLAAILALCGCGSDSTTTTIDQASSSSSTASAADPTPVATIGDEHTIDDGATTVSLTVTDVADDSGLFKVDVTVVNEGSTDYDSTNLNFQSALISTSGETREPAPVLNGPCALPGTDVPPGRDLKACVAFKLQSGFEPATFQYEPSAGGETAEWQLSR